MQAVGCFRTCTQKGCRSQEETAVVPFIVGHFCENPMQFKWIRRPVWSAVFYLVQICENIISWQAWNSAGVKICILVPLQAASSSEMSMTEECFLLKCTQMSHTHRQGKPLKCTYTFCSNDPLKSYLKVSLLWWMWGFMQYSSWSNFKWKDLEAEFAERLTNVTKGWNKRPQRRHYSGVIYAFHTGIQCGTNSPDICTYQSDPCPSIRTEHSV